MVEKDKTLRKEAEPLVREEEKRGEIRQGTLPASELNATRTGTAGSVQEDAVEQQLRTLHTGYQASLEETRAVLAAEEHSGDLLILEKAVAPVNRLDEIMERIVDPYEDLPVAVVLEVAADA